METRHFEFIITGFDMDSGTEYRLGAIVAVTPELVTYTARNADRSRVQVIQCPSAEAQFFLAMMAAVQDVADPDRQIA